MEFKQVAASRRLFYLLIAVSLTAMLITATGCGSKKNEQTTSNDFTAAKKAYDEGKFSEAEQSLNGAIKKSPDDVKSLELLALVEAAQGKNEEAIGRYRAIVTALPKDHASWYRMALLERVAGKPQDSKAHLEMALSLKPGDRGYTDELARTEMGLGEYESAAALWGSLLKSGDLESEGRKELLILQGQAFQSAKMYDKARAAFKAALKLDPNDKALRARVASFK